MAQWDLQERTAAGPSGNFRQFILWAGVAGFGLVVGSKISPWLNEKPIADFEIDTNDPVGSYFSISILLMLFFWSLSWGYHALSELDTLQEWLKPYHVSIRRRFLVHALTVAVGAFLGIIILTVRNPPVLLSVFLTLLFIDLVLWRLRRDEISKYINDNRQRLKYDLSKESPNHNIKPWIKMRTFWKAADVIEEYYLYNNHYLRVSVEIVLCVFGLIAYYEFKSIGMNGVLISAKTDSYILFIIALAAGEVPVFFWRRRMDLKLNRLLAVQRRVEIR